MGNIFTNPNELIKQMNEKYDDNRYAFRTINNGKKNPDIEVIVGEASLTLSFLDEGGIVLSTFAEYANDLNGFANALSEVMGEYAICDYYLVEPMTGIDSFTDLGDSEYNENIVPPASIFACEWSNDPERRLYQLSSGEAYDFEEVRYLSPRDIEKEQADLFKRIVECERAMSQALDSRNDHFDRLQSVYSDLCADTTRYGVDLSAKEAAPNSFMCWYVRQSYNAQVEERQANNQEMVLVSDKQ